MNKDTLEKIEFAKDEIEAAEKALDAAMRLVELAPRSEKVTITASLAHALDRLRGAKADLATLLLER
jgi:hypothetical protein